MVYLGPIHELNIGSLVQIDTTRGIAEKWNGEQAIVSSIINDATTDHRPWVEVYTKDGIDLRLKFTEARWLADPRPVRPGDRVKITCKMVNKFFEGKIGKVDFAYNNGIMLSILDQNGKMCTIFPREGEFEIVEYANDKPVEPEEPSTSTKPLGNGEYESTAIVTIGGVTFKSPITVKI